MAKTYTLSELAIGKLEYGVGAPACEYDGNVRYVRITDITPDGYLEVGKKSPEYYEEKHILNDGDIVFARTGATVGKTFLYREAYGTCVYAGFLIRMIPNQDIVLPEYIYYFTQSPRYWSFVEKNMKVVAQPNINAKQFGKLEIYIPSKQEQNEIVRKLSKLNSLIMKRHQQLDKLDELVKARFIEMFGDPETNTMQWNIEPLDNLCDGIGDGLHGTPEYDDNGSYPFINGNNLSNGSIVITESTKMVDEEVYKKHYIDISENAILISINGTLGKLALYKGEKVMLGKSACFCNLKHEINRVFVYWLMKSDAFMRYLEENSTKSTIKNVGLKAIRNYPMILPPTELQNEFVSFVEYIDRSKLVIKKSLEELEILKKSLMQQYFG